MTTKSRVKRKFTIPCFLFFLKLKYDSSMPQFGLKAEGSYKLIGLIDRHTFFRSESSTLGKPLCQVWGQSLDQTNHNINELPCLRMALDLETRKNNWQIEIEVGKGPDKYQKRGRMAGNSATHRVYRTRIEESRTTTSLAKLRALPLGYWTPSIERGVECSSGYILILHMNCDLQTSDSRDTIRFF